MRMRQNLIDVYKILTRDEILLRLLYYKPQSPNDDPLASDKPNILDKDEVEKWNIISDVIRPIPFIKDLVDVSKCRLIIYPGSRNATGNYLLANQEIVFDIFVHIDFEKYDLRLSAICDRINELICGKEIFSTGKVKFVYGEYVSAPQNYIGYRLVYSFRSVNPID